MPVNQHVCAVPPHGGGHGFLIDIHDGFSFAVCADPAAPPYPVPHEAA